MKRALIACGLALAACAHRADSGALRSQIEAADRAFSQAVAERGRDGFLAFVADDATFLPAGEEPVHGSQAAAQAWAPIFAPGTSLRWQPVQSEVAASGDLGYTVGTYTLTTAEGTRQGKYVTIWRRQPDGTWKAVVDIGNASPKK